MTGSALCVTVAHHLARCPSPHTAALVILAVVPALIALAALALQHRTQPTKESP